MPNAMDVLLNRRCIRAYKPEQIPEAALEAVLQAGRYAPSGMNKQSARFVVVQEPETLKKLSAMNAAVMGGDGDPFYGAPTVVLVLADKAGVTPFQDGCAAMTNMMNAAYAEGLGSCWVNRCKEMFETEAGKALLKDWGARGDWMGIAVLTLGYEAAAHPKAKPRLDDTVLYVR